MGKAVEDHFRAKLRKWLEQWSDVAVSDMRADLRTWGNSIPPRWSCATAESVALRDYLARRRVMLHESNLLDLAASVLEERIMAAEEEN